MSRNSKRKQTAPRGGGKRSSRGTYEVGFGKPPKETQFRPGQSGNPKGRPKGAKNEATILSNIMNRQIDSRQGDQVRKISVLEGILLRFTEDALKGNPRSATFLLNRYHFTEGGEGVTNALDQDDREVLESCMRDLEAKLKGKVNE